MRSHRLDFASFPILGYSLTSDKVPQTQLWEIATYDMKPRLNRLNGVATVLVQGGQQPEFQITPDPSKMLRAHVTIQDILDAANKTNIVDSPGLLSRNHQLFLGLVDSQVHNVEDIGNMVIKNVGDAPVRVRDVGSGDAVLRAELHRGNGQRETRRPAQHQPPAGQQYGGSCQPGPPGN